MRRERLARRISLLLIILGVMLTTVHSQTAFPKVTFGVEETSNPTEFSISLQIVFLLTVLSLAPSILVMMTSFTRLVIAFSFLRRSLATQTVPSNQILIGLALFLTFFIMKPVFTEVNKKAIQPYIKQEITQSEAMAAAKTPISAFMLKQTRPKDLELFIQLRGDGRPQNKQELSLLTIIPAFIISELKTAFQIGFLLYLPMLVIDMVVASVLLSMGMMMLPPVMISMPFKILLFVLVDGWYLLVESLVKGFM